MYKLILISLIILLLAGCSKIEKKLEINNSDNAVAILKIYSYNGKSESKYLIKSLGHSFLTLQNITNESINIHGYDIMPNEEVSIGAWAINSHMGIWFNLESSYVEIYDRYDERVSVSQLINKDELDKINEYLSKNDSYTILSNCSTFAISAWNQIATDSETLPLGFINNPTKLANFILKFNSSKFKEDIIFNENIGFYNGDKFISYQMESNND